MAEPARGRGWKVWGSLGLEPLACPQQQLGSPQLWPYSVRPVAYGQGQLLLLLLLLVAMTAALQSCQKLHQSTMQLDYLILTHLSGGDPEQAMLLQQLQCVSHLT